MYAPGLVDLGPLATGMRHVVVNGMPVVRGGELTGATPGRRLRRG